MLAVGNSGDLKGFVLPLPKLTAAGDATECIDLVTDLLRVGVASPPYWAECNSVLWLVGTSIRGDIVDDPSGAS